MRNKSFVFAASLSLLLGLTSCGGGSTTSITSGEVIGDYYVVTFNFNDSSSRPYSLEVEKGKALEKAPTPSAREGYEFSGWYTEATSGTAVTFPYTVTANVSLYAHWEAAKYDVTFDYNYEGAPAASSVKIEYNKTVTAPETNPTRDKFVFRYWTLDKEGTNQASFPYTVKKNVTFYASWRADDIKVYTVTIHYGDYEGAPANATIEIEDGQQLTRAMITEPEKRSGYEFKGWSLTDGGEIITLPITPTANMDLYAVWEKVSYTVSFYYNYVGAPSSVYASSSYYGGEQFNAPETDPTRPDYVFSGWYTSEKGGNKVTFPTTGYRNLKYYAHWTSNPVTTDTFQAEYTEFDPTFNYPGYSGAAKGDECIIRTVASGAMVDNYPTNAVRPAGNAYAVSYQYTSDAVIRFEITASEAVSGKLSVNWSSEFDAEFAPTGEYAYEITLNGSALSYPATYLMGGRDDNGVPNVTPGPFQLTELANISLKSGVNIIELSPNNNKGSGTMQALAPVIDYLKIDGATNKLSWTPIYDNINGK
ncbi:MAG: InlB B-repeat-containing protein [Bacilli bacterium]|nr:InlB B-repeat-containing protein [Bacilli bacterium]